MIIQCPSCKARYRINVGQTDKATARVRCPKCQAGFEITLPLPVGGQPGQPSPDGASGSRKVLVVDDARFFREVVLDILKGEGFEILVAGDGEEALALIMSERPALVILDLKLPKLDGYGLIQKIRANDELKQTRLLAMSSVFRQEDEVRRVLQAGADDFLNKSFRPDQLLERVARLLEQPA